MEDKQITLQIDGHFITVPEGSTILEAATKIGINIPTLCHIDLKGTCIKNNPASCRICVVEVIGRRNLAPACATRCTEGMVVKTSTLRVMNARKVVAELILSDHPNDCLTCPKCGNCELQTLALRFNIREMPFNGGELSPRKREITASIVRNMDKCIFCRRCESVCNDVQTVGALGAIRRGFNTTIAPAFDRMMTESECTYCGQCVAVCPVGALTERDYTNRLLDDLANPDKVVIVQTQPRHRYSGAQRPRRHRQGGRRIRRRRQQQAHGAAGHPLSRLPQRRHHHPHGRGRALCRTHRHLRRGEAPRQGGHRRPA